MRRVHVVVGSESLDVAVRRVHVAEVTDLAHLLRGGELVLSTGIAMPDDPEALRRYIEDVADAGISGIAVEIGRKYHAELPEAFLDAARSAGAPVILLEREVRFAEITEAVHLRVTNEQLVELRESEKLHSVFTRLSVEGADVARLSGHPVVLENLTHQVLACDLNGEEPATLLASWESRSRSVRSRARTVHVPSTGWLVTTVGDTAVLGVGSAVDDIRDVHRSFLEAGRNKALAASRAHLSRPAFYERLRQKGHHGHLPRTSAQQNSGDLASSSYVNAHIATGSKITANKVPGKGGKPTRHPPDKPNRPPT